MGGGYLCPALLQRPLLSIFVGGALAGLMQLSSGCEGFGPMAWAVPLLFTLLQVFSESCHPEYFAYTMASWELPGQPLWEPSDLGFAL